MLSPSFYLKLSICFAFLAIISLIGLLLTLANFWLVIIISGALFLALQYSCQPLALSYHGLGETVIMFLFGPFCVLGGAYRITSYNVCYTKLLRNGVERAEKTSEILREIVDAINKVNDIAQEISDSSNEQAP